MKPLPKLVLFVAVVAGAVFEYRHLVYTGVIPRPNALKTVIPVKAEDITAEVLAANGVKAAALPSNGLVLPCVDGNTRNCLNGVTQEVEIWAWNANMGFLFAVGGAASDKGIQTSRGSLMEKYGVNVHVVRQDDTNQMQSDLLTTAQRLSSDPSAAGVKFVTIMGDGAAQFFAAINPKLARVCPDCTAEVIAEFGYSRGEDGFWGPKEWKDNPDSMRGGLTIGVLRDGDWNIALKKLGQVNIPNNPDDTVYDPSAMNWISADSYTKAAEMYVSGTCVDLPIKGKIGGTKKHVCAQGVVTWTPGDVTLAKKKGGIVPIMTTKQSAFQMPCVLVGIRRWDRAHKGEIVKMLAAAFEGADQIKTNPEALRRGGEISQALYREAGADAAYWTRYYRGVTETDATGVSVPLGGSTVSNLADNIQGFGLGGSANLFSATYTTFGKIVVQQYPNLVPAFPPVAEILDTGYVQAVRALNTLPSENAESLAVNSTAPMKSIEGRRDYEIQFATGSAQILPSSFAVLNQLADDIVITRYAVAAHGHTDNTGTPDGNMGLSQRRADAVKEYLQGRQVKNVIRSYAHGQEEPIASNATADGKARNRRVQIVLGVVE